MKRGPGLKKAGRWASTKIHVIRPDSAVIGILRDASCGSVVEKKATTEDPRLVTCKRCLTWLHEHVGYHNWLLAHVREKTA